jgi:outer membrane protein assembly factor BamB
VEARKAGVAEAVKKWAPTLRWGYHVVFLEKSEFALNAEAVTSGEEAVKKQGVKIWERELNAPVVCVDFSPQKAWVAASTDAGETVLLDGDGSELMRYDAKAPLKRIRIDETLKRVFYLDVSNSFHAVNLSGTAIFGQRLDTLFHDFCLSTSGYLFWNKRLGVYKADSLVRSLQKLAVRTPVEKLIGLPKSKKIFVVHDPLVVAVYDAKGQNLWYTNNPSPIALGEGADSDLDASASGDSVAISCFEKGVYIYNAQESTLRVLELEYTVMHAAVSGDGRMFLIADSNKKLYLVSKGAETFWEAQFNVGIRVCRLDFQGRRALILFEDGTLAGYEFVDPGEDRSNFLEVVGEKAIPTVGASAAQHRQVWHRPRIPAPPGVGLLALSADGRRFLHGVKKEFILGDGAGNVLWKKRFFTAFEKLHLSRNAKLAALIQAEEIFLLDGETLAEKHLTFFSARPVQLGFDAQGGGFAVSDAVGALTVYSAQGERLWSGNPNFPIDRIFLYFPENAIVVADNKRVLHFFDIKTMKRVPAAHSAPFVFLGEGEGMFYLTDAQGECVALDCRGQIRWKNHIAKKILEVTSLRNGVTAWVAPAGETHVFDAEGKSLGVCRLHGAHSHLNQSDADILEITAHKKSVSCYKLMTGDKQWGINLPSELERALVSPLGDRMLFLDETGVSGWRLGDAPDVLADRGSFLEF